MYLSSIPDKSSIHISLFFFMIVSISVDPIRPAPPVIIIVIRFLLNDEKQSYFYS